MNNFKAVQITFFGYYIFTVHLGSSRRAQCAGLVARPRVLKKGEQDYKKTRVL